jgi:ABC-type branched-subunit amino acid transport system permease subunit
MPSARHDRLGLIAFGVIGLLAMLVLPRFVESFTLLELTVYVIMAILALSLGFVWGYGGILCFGQAAFFGIGAYTYAIASLNFGESTGAVLAAVLVPALFALALGSFMFYARISDVYLGVITLTVSLILFNLVNSTAGDQYRIGSAPLGGFNGIPSIPTLNVPFVPDRVLDPTEIFGVCVAALMLVYYGLRWLLASRFGRVVVGIRENERRAELLGYDTRLYKLGAFVIGGAIAGLAGCLFANWGAFVSPTIFGLAQSAQIIIWIIVGGLGTLMGPVIGCFLIQWLTAYLGALNLVNTNLVLGAVLVAFVLGVPKGLIPTVLGLAGALRARRAARADVGASRSGVGPEPPRPMPAASASGAAAPVTRLAREPGE